MYFFAYWTSTPCIHPLTPTFTNPTVQQYTPGKPHGARQVQGILLCIVTLGQFKAAKRAESVEQVEH